MNYREHAAEMRTTKDRKPTAESPARSDIEEAITTVASRQQGVMTREQLRAAGLTDDAIDGMLKRKRLRPAHRGVYFVSAVVGSDAREVAAVLACGGAGWISHWSAATLLRLEALTGDGSVLHVTVTGNHYCRYAGLQMHRARALCPDEVMQLRGVPLTTAARTLYDLARASSARDLERSLADAVSRGLTNRDEVLRILGRYPRQPGTRKLRALVESDTQPAFTRSQAERRFLDLIRSARLSDPAVNVSVLGHRVDFYWHAEKLVVEVDGFAFHSSADQFEKDRRRDAELTAAGLRVVRVTWRQLSREWAAVLAIVAQALARCARD